HRATPASPPPQPYPLARVRPPARRPDAGLRLLHGRDGMAPASSRPLLHRDRQPQGPPRRHHRQPDWRVGGPASSEPGLEASGRSPQGPLPAPQMGRKELSQRYTPPRRRKTPELRFPTPLRREAADDPPPTPA